MNKKKQVIFTLAGLLLVCILFMAAVVSPEYFTAYTDKKLLNKMEYINASYNAYEVTYTSFAEKVKAIGRITNNTEGISYNSVKINDTDFDYKNISKIIRKEFNKLYKCKVIERKLRLRAGKISSCEKYMLYPSVEKDDIKGISFLKVVYKLKKGAVEVYIDEEYHKIYDFVIPCQLFYKKQPKTKIVQMSVARASYNNAGIIEEKSGIETYFQLMDSLVFYYDFNSTQKDIINIDYNGYIEFSDGTLVETGRWWYSDTSGREYYHIGINLKYKI